MASTAEILKAIRNNPKGVRFADLVKVCDAYFGEPRQKSTSHRVYRTPWLGDPRVNIQNAKGMAKPSPPSRQSNRETGGYEMSDHYTYRITWSAEDNEHVGLCAEFPSLSWLAPTPAAALSGIQRLVRECLADMHTTGEAVPEPIADRNYSGKFMVRLPPESHRALAIQAAEQGVSLNRLVSARLANAT